MHAYNQIIEVSCQAVSYTSSMKTEMRTEWATGGSFTPSTVLHKFSSSGSMVQPTTEFHGICTDVRHRQRAAEAGDPYHDRRGQDLKPLFYRSATSPTIEKMSGQSPRHHVHGGRASGGELNHADARFATMSDRLGYNDRD
jgi:hypothetical protein